jgi:N-acylglucosamine 2-epimerase/mannose-6-phosphate isomerase
MRDRRAPASLNRDPMEDLCRAIRAWMFETALPFWARNGVDHEAGGYVELFDAEGRPRTDYKRVRVIGRQIYVFSHAAVLGWAQGEALSEHGYRFLTEHAWLGDKGGWARRLDGAGGVTDTTPDLYDVAFVLFALAWRHRCSKDPETLVWAHRTLDFAETRLRAPGGQGFLHEQPASGWRQQNPHMHMLEAALAWIESTGDARFRRLADELVSLFAGRFFDAKTQTLAEYYDDDLARAPGEVGRITEPGHQFEWAWILAQHQRLTGADCTSLATGLFDFAESHGVDPVSRATYNTVRDDGRPLDRGSRTWPNTERMKGAIALFELTGRDPTAVLQESGRLLLDRYLNVKPAGTWIDAFDAEGRPTIDTVPASTLYHVFLAFAETLRVAPKLGVKF